MSTTAPNVPQVDPYGVDFAIGPDGDLIVNNSGSLAAVSGVYNCAQAVFMRFKTTPGEVPLHPEYGSNLATAVIGAKMQLGATMMQASADLQTMLAEDPRFVTASVVNAIIPASPQYPQGTLLGVQATLYGGESLTLDNISDPSPSDVSLPQIIDPSIDPTLTYSAIEEQEFFSDSASEYSDLQDLNTLQSIVNDIPNASILGTGG